jgi:hypothetical protein
MCISGQLVPVIKHNGGRLFEELINKEEDRIRGKDGEHELRD